MGLVMIDDASEIDDLLRPAKADSESALAALFTHYRQRLKRMVRMRLDRRLFGRVDASDVLQEAEHATREAEQSRRLLYAADILVAQQVWETGDIGRTKAILDRQWPKNGQTDLRGFEWFYLWGRCQDGSRRTLRGHNSAVPGISLYKDGRTLATVGFGGNGRTSIWDLESGQYKTILGPIALALAPDGRTLALGRGLSIDLWSLNRGRIEFSFSLPARPSSAAFSPDSARLAVGCGNSTIHVFDLKTQQKLKLEGDVLQNGPVFKVAFWLDGRTLASGWASGMVWLWDLDKGRLVLPLKGHAASIIDLCLTPDGKALVSTSADASIRLWDRATGNQLHTMRVARTCVKVSAPGAMWRCGRSHRAFCILPSYRLLCPQKL
jgi:hypothetical protein